MKARIMNTFIFLLMGSFLYTGASAANTTPTTYRNNTWGENIQPTDATPQMDTASTNIKRPNNATLHTDTTPTTNATPLSGAPPVHETKATAGPATEFNATTATTAHRSVTGTPTLPLHTIPFLVTTDALPLTSEVHQRTTSFRATRVAPSIEKEEPKEVDFGSDLDYAATDLTPMSAKYFSWDPIRWSWVLILQLLSAVIGIVGNFLVIIVLFQRRKKSRSTDTLIGGLACADFLTSVFIVPHPWATSVPGTWLGEVYCRVIYTRILLWTSITSSAYLLMSISVERYIAIINPLHFNLLFTRRRVSLFIAAVWVLSVLSGIFVYIVFAVDPLTGSCTEAYMSVRARVAIAYYWFTLRLVIPCLTMLVTQVLIARELHRQSVRFRGITSTGQSGGGSVSGGDGTTIAKISGNQHQAHLGNSQAWKGNNPTSYHIVARNRVIKMMLIVVLIYIVCWSPNQIAYLGYNLGWVKPSYISSTLHDLLTVLGFYNSCANPVIYTARYPEFREALRDILTCTPTKSTPLFEKGNPSDKYVATTIADRGSNVENNQA